MGRLVLGAHSLPYNDYWPMLDSILTDSGGLDAGGLFELRNEHPLVVGKLLYWLNLRATGGSNVALGLVVMGIAVGQLAVIAVLARDLGRHWRLAPPLLVVTAASLLFARQGAWHFVKSMSGAAWLTANLFALLAIWAQLRLRHVLAVAFAALATMSYGTGLAVWPVLILVGLLAGARPKHLVPAFVTGVLATIWLQVQLADIGKSAEDRPPVLVWAARGAEVIGAFLFPGHRVTDIRVGEGLVAIGIVAALVVVYRWLRRSEEAATAAPWIGLVAYGAGMGLLVAAGRNTFLWTGTQGRYAAIGALTCLGVAGLVLALLPRRGAAVRPIELGAIAGLGLLCLVVLTGGHREVRSLEASYGPQDLLGVALETRIFDGSRIWLGNIQAMDAPGVEDRLERAGHDFHVEDDNDCGLLGSTVDRAELSSALPAGVRGETVRQEAGGRALPKGIVFDGWIEGAAIDCALMIDPAGEVVGAGGHGLAREGYGGIGATDVPGRVWFSGVAPTSDGAVVYVRLHDHDSLYALPFPG
jgi:hypothetical protein